MTMTDDATIAALERAVWAVEKMALLLPYMAAAADLDKSISVDAIKADATTIRDHIAKLRNPLISSVNVIEEARADERAKVVAWLRKQPALVPISETHLGQNGPKRLADAIEAGAHQEAGE